MWAKIVQMKTNDFQKVYWQCYASLMIMFLSIDVSHDVDSIQVGGVQLHRLLQVWLGLASNQHIPSTLHFCLASYQHTPTLHFGLASNQHMPSTLHFGLANYQHTPTTLHFGLASYQHTPMPDFLMSYLCHGCWLMPDYCCLTFTMVDGWCQTIAVLPLSWLLADARLLLSYLCHGCWLMPDYCCLTFAMVAGWYQTIAVLPLPLLLDSWPEQMQEAATSIFMLQIKANCPLKAFNT